MIVAKAVISIEEDDQGQVRVSVWFAPKLSNCRAHTVATACLITMLGEEDTTKYLQMLKEKDDVEIIREEENKAHKAGTKKLD